MRVRARLPVSLPDHRTLHSGAIPRTGGLAVWLGVAAWALASARAPAWLPALACLVLVFAVEDWRGLPAGLRLLVQGIAVAAVLTVLSWIRTPCAAPTETARPGGFTNRFAATVTLRMILSSASRPSPAPRISTAAPIGESP